MDFNLAKGSYRHLIRNLSEGGAFIDSGVDIALGETIELMVFSMRRHQHCTVRGRVVRREPHGFAVHFVDPDAAQPAFLLPTASGTLHATARPRPRLRPGQSARVRGLIPECTATNPV